ncbi:unnamed protein product [Bursaphelenchus xylophilus]|uniref:(pine wood nematode) hypothetical protein n=1 Tax=Bursaphelenchus xylophilus TaxID=6326 RepID=A0A1I7SBL5_BURXY|nr:unnamed protein product [Bursaphelenchus xylophilus]CAG9114455.1 unnamed protein product [Bursaphelenchus xylophilus]
MQFNATDTYPVTVDIVRQLVPSRSFPTQSNRFINSLDFDDSGKFLLSAGDDDQLMLYNIMTGDFFRAITSKKYGCSCARYLHSDQHVVHASTKRDDTIRLLSLYDQKYIRYFQGHKETVTGLSVSPIDDMFITSSKDRTIRFWDAKQEVCAGVMNLPEAGAVAFDPEGLVIAVAIGSEQIRLYDKRSYENGPFISFDLGVIKDTQWTNIKFSEDGKSILIMTSGNYHRLIDAFNGGITHSLTGHTNHSGAVLDACFSPDSQFIFCGGTDGRITVWSREDGTIVHQFNSDQRDPVLHCLYNPFYHIMASAGLSTKLWTLQ